MGNGEEHWMPKTVDLECKIEDLMIFLAAKN